MSETGPWWAAWVECPVCGHEYVAVFPDQVERLECSRCGHMMERPEETQPWFTHKDVMMLRISCGDERKPNRVFYTLEAFDCALRDLAARIQALLPPEKA